MEERNKERLLNVLMTTDTVGGVWSYSLELCKALRDFNVHFYLVTTGRLMQPSQKDEAGQLENVTVYETDFLLEWMDDPWQSIDSSGGWLIQLEQELKPDLVHLNGYAYGVLPWKAPLIIAAHSDVFSWWKSVNNEYPPEEWNKYFQRVQAGLQQADLLIAPSKAMMKEIQTIYSTNSPGKVIYNGRSSDTFYPAEKQLYICSFGRLWDEAKNISLLVEAATHIPYPIKIAGDNSFGTDSCSTEGVNITYLGKLPASEIALQLSAASVYVLPAKYEPFGLSILEAALSGCALVLGNIDSLREIWGDSALYIDTNDSAALAATINYLMENGEDRLRYSRKAMIRAKQYSTTMMASNYIDAYHQLLNKEMPLAQREITLQ